MSTNEDDPYIEVNPTDLEVFRALCREHSVEAVVDRRDLTNYVDTITIYTTAAGGAITGAKLLGINVRGAMSNIAVVDRLWDRKEGGHIIYTAPNGEFADARSREISYGLVRAVGPHERIDIDARERIIDTKTRTAFAEEVKCLLRRHRDWREIPTLVSGLAGVTYAKLIGSVD